MLYGRPKKMLIMYILEILNKYTDEEHTLSQRDIQKLLERDYDMKVDRKAVKANLFDLIQAEYPIEYRQIVRETPDRATGEMIETEILTDFYITRTFTDAELRLIIDSILFSKNIPPSDRKRLIANLEGLSNIYFRSKVKHIQSLATDVRETNKLFLTIDYLDEAISQEKQVKFHYDYYGADKKLHHRKADGKPREYTINPYSIVAANGRYYLLCNLDKYDDLSHYRLDRISDIQVLDTPVKPKNMIKGLEHGLDVSKHMAEHIYMFTGKSIRARFKAPKYLISDILDYFGSEIRFKELEDDMVLATVTINEQDMKLWAMQYASQVTVLEPAALVDSIKSELHEAYKKYCEE